MSPLSAPTRVLLVDDDPNFLMTMRAILGDFDVTACTSADEGMAALAKRPYHVVCADWQMPGIDGLEFLRRVMGNGFDVGCILITAHPVDFIERVPWVDRKMLGILQKPFKPEELLDRVRHYAGMAAMRRALSALKVVIEGQGGRGRTKLQDAFMGSPKAPPHAGEEFHEIGLLASSCCCLGFRRLVL